MIVLACSCTHCPVMLPGYVDFLRDVWNHYSCTQFVHLGDLVDKQAMSFHERDPDLPSAGDELKAAVAQAKTLYHAFPSAEVIVGNHDALPSRQARAAGISEKYMRKISDVLETPSGWNWHKPYSSFVLDGVRYMHGDGKGRKGGKHAAINNAKALFQSVVMGHWHSQAGVTWYANEERLIYGVSVGVGLDRTARAMRYAEADVEKPIVGCAIIADGVYPLFVPMEI